ncbi:MAG: hypothetical protein ACYC7D_10560 [Nitrososphaerales archaeon]
MPRSLGISSPLGRDVYEFYLVVKSTPSILGKISDIFGKKHIDVLGAHLQVSDDRQKRYAIFYVEMAGSTAKANEFVELFRHEEFVLEIAAESRNVIFFETKMFPPTSGGHYRVFAMGSESWINLVRSLKEKFGSAADSILHAEGIPAGEGIARGIESRVNDRTKDVGKGTLAKLENLKALFKVTGFGLLEILGNAERFHVTIRESMAAKQDLIEHFVVGVVEGALEKLFSKEYVISDLKHDVNDGAVWFNLTTKAQGTVG